MYGVYLIPTTNLQKSIKCNRLIWILWDYNPSNTTYIYISHIPATTVALQIPKSDRFLGAKNHGAAIDAKEKFIPATNSQQVIELEGSLQPNEPRESCSNQKWNVSNHTRKHTKTRT